MKSNSVNTKIKNDVIFTEFKYEQERKEKDFFQGVYRVRQFYRIILQFNI